MASQHHNLSDFDKGSIPSAANMVFGIVVSEWNPEITDKLLEGAVSTLMSNDAEEKNIHTKHVPGSFELPLGAQYFLEYTKVDAVICLGSVIRGETPHFDYICQTVSQGIKDVALKYGKPVVFGVLTDDNMQQAKDRSGGKHGNKGDDVAVAAMKMIALQQELKNQSR